MARLKDKYVSEIAPALMSKFGYKSVMQIPKLDKVVVNVGCGDAKDNPKMMDAILGDIATVTGQRPVVCRAKKSVANFKPACVTSAASTATPSTAAATTPWASRSS